MSREYTMKLYRGGGWKDADEVEREYVVTYTISKGYPATGPSYASGGEPAEPPEVELIDVTCDGLPFASAEHDDWFVHQIAEQHDHADEASERAEHRYEQLRDQRMMDD